MKKTVRKDGKYFYSLLSSRDGGEWFTVKTQLSKKEAEGQKAYFSKAWEGARFKLKKHKRVYP